MSKKRPQPHCEHAARYIEMLNKFGAKDEFSDTTVQDILDMVAEGLLKPDDVIMMAEEHAILESVRDLMKLIYRQPS